MKRSKFIKRFFGIFLPVSLIAFLIIAITLTFGDSDAGKAMGVLEGCIVFLIAVWLLFLKEMNGLARKFLKPLFKKRNSPSVKAKAALGQGLPSTEEKSNGEHDGSQEKVEKQDD